MKVGKSYNLGATASDDAGADIIKLNARVADICKKKVEEAEKNGTKLPLDITAALKPMDGINAGFPIYQVRSEALVYLAMLVCLPPILLAIQEKGLFRIFCYFCVMFVAYDFYSGCLHVVLDNPKNIALPVLGQPCLEFQWHHYIPNDITSKTLVQACGDLNMVMLLSMLLHLTWSTNYCQDTTALGLFGLKLFVAYYGQFSHRSAHNFLVHRIPTWGPLIKMLQKTPLLISAADHKIHHTKPHDLDFCLIGLCNPLFDFLNTKVVTNPVIGRWLWLGLFLSWSVVDIAVLSWAVKATIG